MMEAFNWSTAGRCREAAEVRWLLGSGLASHGAIAQGLVIAADHLHNLEETRVTQSPLGEKIVLHHFPMTSK